MRRFVLLRLLPPGLLALALTGCGQSYSPNTYAATAAQQQATVERGVIIGVRQILISPDGTIGAATGGAVGGVAGAQIPGGAVTTAFGAIGGTLVGGLTGVAAEKAAGKTKGWEYIVQETGEKLVSVTQTSKVSLPVGLSVLVIAGSQQARIVPDYTVQIAATKLAAKVAAAPPSTSAAPNASQSIEVNLSPLSQDTEPVDSFQLAPAPAPAPAPAASDPVIPTQPGPGPANPGAMPPAASSLSSTAAADPVTAPPAQTAPATPSPSAKSSTPAVTP